MKIWLRQLTLAKNVPLIRIAEAVDEFLETPDEATIEFGVCRKEEKDDFSSTLHSKASTGHVLQQVMSDSTMILRVRLQC